MRLLLTIGAIVVATPIVAWMAGAIYYDICGAGRYARRAALAWSILWLLAFAIWHPVWKPLVLLLGLVAAFLAWWLRLRPSQSRAWDPHFAQTARIAMQGDVLTIANVRNSEYYGIRQGTARYETRTYHLSNLRGVDALILTWGSPWMSHPMFVFDFGPDGRVCMSIEVRYREGQRFNLLRTLYRQQELMYVVSDERDAILRRTKYMVNHKLYLYRMDADDLSVRRFFLDYATSINKLAAAPRWYHGLTTNCTTSIYAQGRGHIQWDWRLLWNGTLDERLYELEFFDQRLPFARLKDLSRVNDVANQAPEQGFGDYLREHLPGYSIASAPTLLKPPAPPVDS
jgi:hypothetical protein